MSELAAFLGQHPLFARLTPQLRVWLAGQLTVVRVKAGDWLFREGDVASSSYLVRSGRLELWKEAGPQAISLGVVGPGGGVGEASLLTGERQAASVIALRDSELVQIDWGHFVGLTRESRSFSSALLTSLGQALVAAGGMTTKPPPRRSVLTLTPLDAAVPVARVRDELAAHLRRWGSTAVLREGLVSTMTADDGPACCQRLDELERAHTHVLLETDAPSSGDWWTEFCLRQADRVLALVGRAPPPASVPPHLLGCELVFVQDVQPSVRAEWLDRLRPRAHHHLTAGRTFADGVAILGRRVTGRSNGVVLSGGGARGLAHIGVLRGLLDAGVTIDRVGGTSMGAFIGALFADGNSPQEMTELVRRELVAGKPFADYTLPRVSLARGIRARGMMERLFGSTNIEDLALDFFCVTADLITGNAVIHRRGDVLSTVGASMSIPGWAPPLRMGDHILVDGGVLNNFPVDVMVATEEGPVIGVNAMGMSRNTTSVSGGQRHRLPNIMETLAAAVTLGSRRAAEKNAALAQLVINPDVGSTGLLEFDHLDRLLRIGSDAALQAIASAPSLVGDGGPQ